MEYHSIYAFNLIELSAGYKFGFRLGINLIAVLDFFTGLVLLDLEADDIGWQNEE